MWIAVNTPIEGIHHAHAYTLFFSGQDTDGVTVMGWNNLDNGLSELTFDSAKALAERLLHVMFVVGEAIGENDVTGLPSTDKAVNSNVGAENSGYKDGIHSYSGQWRIRTGL